MIIKAETIKTTELHSQSRKEYIASQNGEESEAEPLIRSACTRFATDANLLAMIGNHVKTSAKSIRIYFFRFGLLD